MAFQDASNDIIVDLETPAALKVSSVNGQHYDAPQESSIEELEKELPVVLDGQIPLGDLLSRVVQSIYAELSELAET